MPVHFTCDLSSEPTPLPHFWEFCVGSGHATLALRADWQEQLRQCKADLGFQHVRFHGILDDDMGTLIDQSDELLYSFHAADQIFDFLRSIDMRPIVELSFMPLALSSGSQTVFHYGANVTPPADYSKWATLVSKLARHWIDRYGANEVSLWPIEVWNEPNMKSFWTGSKEDYFRLFSVTFEALKLVHPDLKIGGPVTAQNAWIGDFLDYCQKANISPDFVSTHTYPTDAMGSPGDDTKKTLAASHLGILTERAKEVRDLVGDKPLYYTEWSTSSNPRDELHDDAYAAAYIVHAMLTMGDLVDAYSYWTFSDIFEENYMPSKPFQGGFGLMTLQGVPKPAYRAYELLHALGAERLSVDGSHATVSVWATRSDDAIDLVIVNLALPEHDIKAETVSIELFGAPSLGSATARRIDAEHANPKARWRMQGEPRYPTDAEVAAMIDASRMRPEGVALERHGGSHRLELTVQPQSVTAIRVALDAKVSSSPVQGPTTTKAVFGPDEMALLGDLQSAAFGYFTRYADPTTGLVADSSKEGSSGSIAATGFALSCYPVAVEHGWMSRADAAETVLRTLSFFAESRQGPEADATGYKGFYYHFLHMTTGQRANDCELSTIDTAILMAGIVVAEQYFNGRTETEEKIVALASMLCDRVDWQWALTDDDEIQESWKPESGFVPADWVGYTEAQLLYVIGAGSPTHPLPRRSYERDAADFHWSRNSGLDWIEAAPLFIHLFPQAWIDLRGLDDGFVGKGGIDYFENTRRAIAVQQGYAHLNPKSFEGYGSGIWGLSACEGPDSEHVSRDGRVLKGLGYAARGVPGGPDDGTLVPWAAATCVAHRPVDALSDLRVVLATYPEVLSEGRFLGAFNPSLDGQSAAGWVAPASFGIDQGLVVMMIENATTGFIWNLTRNAKVIRRGLTNLNFKRS